jgi:aryl-alcohol dehydrogenase-like predicted oxidoreductase
MLLGRATKEATARYAARFDALRQHLFYRDAHGLCVSSIGIGSYLGEMDGSTDQGYTDAVAAAVVGGVNVIDTALNYRHQRSERAIGQAILRIASTPPYDRDEILVCSKAGYLVPGAVPRDLSASHIAAGVHCMAPDFLSDQLQRSRENLGIETIDVYYLHNPETQLDSVPREDFDMRLRAAFERLERHAADGHIQYYGAATWQGFRAPGKLRVTRIAALAREVAGDNHRFRFIQLPFNLAMMEAMTEKTDESEGAPVNPLGAAAELGITVIASASLLQSRLAGDLPEQLEEALPGLRTNAQRAIQFTRSTPGITSALIGMSKIAHVEENLGVGNIAPLDAVRYLRLLGAAR